MRVLKLNRTVGWGKLTTITHDFSRKQLYFLITNPKHISNKKKKSAPD